MSEKEDESLQLKKDKERLKKKFKNVVLNILEEIKQIFQYLTKSRLKRKRNKTQRL